MTYANKIGSAVIGNKHTGFLDVEKLPQSHFMFSGVTTLGGSSYLRLNIASAIAAVVHQMNVWLNYDVIVALNMLDSTVEVFS